MFTVFSALFIGIFLVMSTWEMRTARDNLVAAAQSAKAVSESASVEIGELAKKVDDTSARLTALSANVHNLNTDIDEMLDGGLANLDKQASSLSRTMQKASGMADSLNQSLDAGSKQASAIGSSLSGLQAELDAGVAGAKAIKDSVAAGKTEVGAMVDSAASAKAHALAALAAASLAAETLKAPPVASTSSGAVK